MCNLPNTTQKTNAIESILQEFVNPLEPSFKDIHEVTKMYMMDPLFRVIVDGYIRNSKILPSTISQLIGIIRNKQDVLRELSETLLKGSIKDIKEV